MLLNLGRGLAPLSSSAGGQAADLSAKTVAVFGDSITSQNTSANGQEYLPQGYMSVLNAITGQRYGFDPSYNLGVGGDNLATMDGRKTDLAALSPAPDLVFVLGGTNDIVAATSAAGMQSSLGNIYSYITGTLGAKVVALTIPPRTQYPGGEALSGTDQTKLETVNSWIQAQGSDDVLVIDIYPALVSSGSTPDAGKFNKEGTSGTAYVHPNPAGALAIADTIKAALSPLYGVYDIPDMSISNLLANDTLSGTGGTNNSSLTGQVADGNTFYAYAAGSGTLSKPTSSTQKIDISYTNSTAYDTLQFYEADVTSGYTPGGNVLAEAEIEIVSGQRIEGLWVELTDKGGSNLLYKGLSKYDDPEFPDENRTYFMQTPIVTTQGDSSALGIKIRGELNSVGGETAALEFIIKQVRCRTA